MRVLVSLCVALSLGSTIVSAQSPPKGDARIPVYVRPAGADGEFTDPSKDRQDSTRDILGRIRQAKWIRPVTSEADATIVLEVLDRDDRTKTSFWAGRERRTILPVRMTVGEFETEFTGQAGKWTGFNGATWKNAASKIIKQVDEWAKANYPKLRDRAPGSNATR